MTDYVKGGEFTIEELKKRMNYHYNRRNDRDMFISLNPDNHYKIGSVFISLTGSPPKGYAIYTPNLRNCSVYGNRGERWRNYYVTIPEIDNLIDKDIFKHEILFFDTKTKELRKFKEYKGK